MSWQPMYWLRLAALTTACAVSIGLSPVQAPAAAKNSNHGLFAEDLVSLRKMADPQISPDGQKIVFVLRQSDLDGSASIDLWLLDLADTSTVKRLTTSDARDFQPRWSVDGRSIYFLSDRAGSIQVWSLPVDGGEARQITDLPVDLAHLAISPVGDRIAFSANVYPGCETLLCTATRMETEEASPETGLVYDRLIVRYWDKWRDGRQNHLFTAALPDNNALITEAFDVSGPLFGDVPEKPFGSTASIAFSADGQNIFFSIKLQDSDESWSLNSDIYSANAYANAFGRGRTVEPSNLTADNPGRDINPIVSPDGKWLAWLATEGATRYAAERKIKLMKLVGGEVKTLAPGWDRSPDAIAFSGDSKSLFARAHHLGTKALFSVPLDGPLNGQGNGPMNGPMNSNDPTLLTTSGSVTSFIPVADGVIYSTSDLGAPADLFRLEAGNKTPERLTAVNADKLQDIRMADYQQFSFEGADGDKVYGYVMEPVDFSSRKSYPVALIIHGGPHGSMGDSFHYRWNPQVYAAHGYATVFIDFHGSVGYGQKFVESIMGDRGGRTLEDQKLGLTAALKQYPWLNGDRVCALGASFGGYMVNWIAGAWPERFRCLVNHDGMFDNRMKYYAGDIIGYLEEGFEGTYFDNPEAHEKFNPARLVSDWQTPMLVIHGGKDYRVPETQGLGAYTALQRKGIPSRLLYFPDENHWVQKPANSVQWHGEVIGWLDRWLKDE